MINCSKVLDQSINKVPAKPGLSKQSCRLSISANTAHCVLNPLLYPQSETYFCIICSNILGTVGRTFTGL